MVRLAHHPEQRRRVNLKFQYPMTKTLTASGLYRTAKLPLLVIMKFGTNEDQLFGILNLGHWDLIFDFWCLEFQRFSLSGQLS